MILSSNCRTVLVAEDTGEMSTRVSTARWVFFLNWLCSCCARLANLTPSCCDVLCCVLLQGPFCS